MSFLLAYERVGTIGFQPPRLLRPPSVPSGLRRASLKRGSCRFRIAAELTMVRGEQKGRANRLNIPKVIIHACAAIEPGAARNAG